MVWGETDETLFRIIQMVHLSCCTQFFLDLPADRS